MRNLPIALQRLPEEMRRYDVVHYFLHGDLSMLLVDSQFLLTEEEYVRSAKIKGARQQMNFIIRRTLLKQFLGSIMKINPVNVVYTSSVSGKPKVNDGPHFSHSNKLGALLFSFSWTSPIGVDLEPVDRSIDGSRIASCFFSSKERLEMYQAHPTERTRCFFRTWTKKEALAKCLEINVLDTCSVSESGVCSFTFLQYQIAIAFQMGGASQKIITWEVGTSG